MSAHLVQQRDLRCVFCLEYNIVHLQSLGNFINKATVSLGIYLNYK